jgi:hypothetical protein
MSLFRKHIYADLQPYSCYYESCVYSSQTFADRDSWTEHLGLEHGLAPEWRSRQCPLCLTETGDGKTTLTLHIARHFEELALAALPTTAASEPDEEEPYELEPQESDSVAASNIASSTSEHPPEQEEPVEVRCPCGFVDDDGNIVLCELCNTWQHVQCFYPNRDLPDTHECDRCMPRRVDTNIVDANSATTPLVTDSGRPRRAAAPVWPQIEGTAPIERHQSISSLGKEPSTSHTVALDDYEDGFPQTSQGQKFSSQNVKVWLDKYLQYDDADTIQRAAPKFDKTMPEFDQETAYNPVTPGMTSSNQYVSPSRNIITERLQAAQMARLHSSTSVGSRGISPLLEESPYVRDPHARFRTAAQLRQQQKQRTDALELSQHWSAQGQSTLKTIVPKEAHLEYTENDENEEDAEPLFLESSQNSYTQQSQVTSGQQNYLVQEQVDNTGSYNFSPTPVSANSGVLPFSSQNYRSANSSMPTTKQEETPDFPFPSREVLERLIADKFEIDTCDDDQVGFDPD